MDNHQDTSKKRINKEQSRKYMQRKRYMQKRLIKTFGLLLVITAIGVTAAALVPKGNKSSNQGESIETGAKPAVKDEESKDLPAKQPEEQVKPQDKEEQEDKTDVRAAVLEQADLLAAGYDYDSAIETVKSYEGYERDSELTAKITDYENKKAACVPVDIDKVTHVFYHSLVVDPELCFADQETNPQAVGNNQWMTTIEEFNKITQIMYDKGYVLVDLHDMVKETTDENGNVHFEKGEIMLPPDKKAFVLSVDDLSYYHSYDGYGYASKMVLDENGKPKCEYIQRDGTTVVGDYDVVPLMNKFIEEHPDASYRGARGTIALTGYNGILGYRTDITYQTVPEDIDTDKRKWLENHPDFDLERERAEAKKVAEAIKAEGWKFASHTWGHLKVGEAS